MKSSVTVAALTLSLFACGSSSSNDSEQERTKPVRPAEIVEQEQEDGGELPTLEMRTAEWCETTGNLQATMPLNGYRRTAAGQEDDGDEIIVWSKGEEHVLTVSNKRIACTVTEF